MRNLLISLMIFLGIGAIAGGFGLIISPSGQLLELPLSILENSPFHSFLIPGIILFSVLGIRPLLIAFALAKKPKSSLASKINFFTDMHWAWSFCIYIGFALIIWIQVEMVIMQSVHWLHTFYMLYAVIILFVALLPPVRRNYKL